MALTKREKEVIFNTSKTSKSYSKNLSFNSIDSSRIKGTTSPRTNLEQGWLMKNDFIRARYLDELARDTHKYAGLLGYSFKDDDSKVRPRSRSLEYVPKDRVRLRYGRIEKIPIGHSGSRNLSNEERVVPIRYLGGNHWKTNKPLNFTTAILPKRNSRDTLSHRGNFLHFVA